MKKIVMCLGILVLALLQGCGTWCSKDRAYCMEGFSGFTRYQGYNTQYYYPMSVLTVENDLKKGSCSIYVVIDGIQMGQEIKLGEFKRIEIKSPPNENRQATVLVKRYCGGKPKGSYANLIQISSMQPTSHVWVMDERYFPRR